VTLVFLPIPAVPLQGGGFIELAIGFFV